MQRWGRAGARGPRTSCVLTFPVTGDEVRQLHHHRKKLRDRRRGGDVKFGMTRCARYRVCVKVLMAGPFVKNEVFVEIVNSSNSSNNSILQHTRTHAHTYPSSPHYENDFVCTVCRSDIVDFCWGARERERRERREYNKHIGRRKIIGHRNSSVGGTRQLL
jgi:hypothetical protein